MVSKNKNGKIFGISALILSIIAILPLLWNVTIKQNTQSIHYMWILLTFLSSILWFIYGKMNNLLPNIIIGGFKFFISIIIFIFKFHYENKIKF